MVFANTVLCREQDSWINFDHSPLGPGSILQLERDHSTNRGSIQRNFLQQSSIEGRQGKIKLDLEGPQLNPETGSMVSNRLSKLSWRHSKLNQKAMLTIIWIF